MLAFKDKTVARKLGYVAQYGADCTAGRKLAASYKALRRERNALLAVAVANVAADDYGEAVAAYEAEFGPIS